jgi:hypothetical protein
VQCACDLIKVNATSHERGDVTRNMTVDALNSKGAKVITVFSGTDFNAISQLNNFSSSTGAIVPECAGNKLSRTSRIFSFKNFLN